MNAVIEAAQKMGEAVSKMQDTMNVVGIKLSGDIIRVEVKTIRDLQQAPGVTEFIQGPGDLFPVEARVTVEKAPGRPCEIQFFLPLTAEKAS